MEPKVIGSTSPRRAGPEMVNEGLDGWSPWPARLTMIVVTPRWFRPQGANRWCSWTAARSSMRRTRIVLHQRPERSCPDFLSRSCPTEPRTPQQFHIERGSNSIRSKIVALEPWRARLTMAACAGRCWRATVKAHTIGIKYDQPAWARRTRDLQGLDVALPYVPGAGVRRERDRVQETPSAQRETAIQASRSRCSSRPTPSPTPVRRRSPSLARTSRRPGSAGGGDNTDITSGRTR